MPTSAVKANATEVTYEAGDVELEVLEFIGRVNKLHRGPQVFTSAYPAGFVIPPHFHLSDQCQVFIEGSATMGSHDVSPVTVHYADKYVAYGPIVIGGSGLTFFNFRARCDVGAEMMPEARKRMTIRSGREIGASCRLRLADAIGGQRMQSVVDLDDDGLVIDEIIAGPGHPLHDTQRAATEGSS